MTTDDFVEFRDTWLAVYELTSWKAEKPSQTAMAIAFEALAPLMTLGEYMAAMKAHVSDPVAGKHPPSIAGLIASTQDGHTAEEAFEEVLSALSTVGPYRTPSFADQRTAGAVSAIGGWAQLNTMTYDALSRLLPRFAEAYAEGAPPSRKALRGLVEIHNEEHLLGRKPELIERFPHEVVHVGDDDTRRLN